MLEVIAYGLTIGGILYIISIGFSLTFGSMRIVNFAHGLVYAIGAYALYALLPVAKGHFLPAANPAPPRPRRLAFFTSFKTFSGLIAFSALASAV